MFSEREMNKPLVLCELTARANCIHGHSVEGKTQATMSVLTLSGFSQFGAMKVWDNVQELLIDRSFSGFSSPNLEDVNVQNGYRDVWLLSYSVVSLTNYRCRK